MDIKNFQVEVIYLRSVKDILLLVHVTFTKRAEILYIHCFLPFPILIIPKPHDMTIALALYKLVNHLLTYLLVHQYWYY